MANVVDLPVELLVKILSSLTSFQLGDCQLICRHFSQVIAEASQLQYVLELGRWKYQEVSRSKRSVADRLQSIRTIQNSWRNPQPRSIVKKSLDLPDISVRERRWWTAHNGAIVRHTKFKPASNSQSVTQIDLIDVLSVLDKPSPMASFMLKFPYNNFYVDVVQGLIVAVELERESTIHLHLLSILSGGIHPNAQHASIVRPRPAKDVYMDISVRAVVGPFLCIDNTAGPDSGPGFSCVELFHWPSGECIQVWERQSSAFLPSGILLMAGTQRLQDHLQPSIEVWKVGEEYTPESKPIHVATYLLPLLPLNSYPGMYFGGNTCDVASSGTDLGFRPSQCALLLLNQGGHDLIVSTDVFKDVCTSNADRDRAAEPPVYTWSEWGPSYTRIMSGAWGTSPRCGYRILHGGEIWDFTPNMASEPLDLAASAPQSVCHIHKQECVYSQVGSAAAMPCRRIRADAIMGESKRRDVSYMIETASGPVVRVVERFLLMWVGILTFIRTRF